MSDCPFCKKLSTYPSGVVAFKPLNPVVPGHTLVVPTRHVEDFADDPDETARVMRFAAEYVRSDEWKDSGHVNLISSRGVDATQSVFHLHVHLIPRWPNDGLRLPWSAAANDRRCESCGARVSDDVIGDSEGVVVCEGCSE